MPCAAGFLRNRLATPPSCSARLQGASRLLSDPEGAGELQVRRTGRALVGVGEMGSAPEMVCLRRCDCPKSPMSLLRCGPARATLPPTQAFARPPAHARGDDVAIPLNQ